LRAGADGTCPWDKPELTEEERREACRTYARDYRRRNRGLFNAIGANRYAAKSCCVPLCRTRDPERDAFYVEAAALTVQYGEPWEVDHRLPVGKLPEGVTWADVKTWAVTHGLDHLPVGVRVRRYLSATGQFIRGVSGWLLDDKGVPHWTDGVVGLHVAANLRSMRKSSNITKLDRLVPDLCGLLAGMLEDPEDQRAEVPVPEEDILAVLGG
jgi:hypothetical protein